MLTLRNITLGRGNNILLDNASFTLYEKQKQGIVGRNGCGKSTLFDLILGKLAAESGELQLNSAVKISHLAQHIPETDEPALEYVLSGDTEYRRLQSRLAKAEAGLDHEAVLACHALLEDTEGYSKPAKAATIMAGLGFITQEQTKPVNSFSGGWRMRLNLARCLMQMADLFLLDEPTNHLDMEAIFWLEKWLKQVPASVLVISHDREFLDKFVTHIIHIENQQVTSYTGNYSDFERMRAQYLLLQQKTYEKQQQRISHLMSFVTRFRAKASKSRQAQSRLKLIDKIELVAQAQVDSPFSFSFYSGTSASNPLIRCFDVDAGYIPEQPILKTINFQLNNGDRIALLGSNGQGKSTLIKTLTGGIMPLTGEVFRSANLKIGYYAQHQLEELDFNLSPLETIQYLSPDAREQEIRDYLGGFNFLGDMAVNPIQHFSGGEKARLALAKLVWQKPNLLLLDEPTNHLDLDMRAAIEIALQSFEGALILISHDRHLLDSTVDNFYLVYDSKVQLFNGDLDEYYTWLLNKESSKTTAASSCAPRYKDKKALQNRAKKIEQLLEELQNKLTKNQLSLADPALYESSAHEAVQKLLLEQKSLQHECTTLEEEWLTIATTLEGN